MNPLPPNHGESEMQNTISIRIRFQKEPSVAQSDTSGYSHLAGDVDRWIHGSSTNVANNGTNVASNGTNEANNAANVAINAANSTLTSIGVQSSRLESKKSSRICRLLDLWCH